MSVHRIKVGSRVEHNGAAAEVVHRVDSLFVEIFYDEPQQRLNYAGEPYETRYVCIHQDLLTVAGSLALW